jgi:hypothetical protein
MALIGDEEIFARVHKYKIFRKEGNLFIDVYEAMLGKPAHKFMAVPNLLIQEGRKAYFGVGDTQKEALRECLSKIKDVPIEEIIPLEEDAAMNPEQESDEIPPEESKDPSPIRKFYRTLLGRKSVFPQDEP